MIPLVEQAVEVQRFLDDHGWRSCVIGGLAVIRWGEPRLTRYAVDIAGIIGRQRAIDWPAIHDRLSPLVELKEEPEILRQATAFGKR